MTKTSLRFHFHGGQTSLFKDLDDDMVKKVLEALQDTRIESFVIGNQWINKNGIITVFPEPLVQEVPAETNIEESVPGQAECPSCVEPLCQPDQPA